MNIQEVGSPRRPAPISAKGGQGYVQRQNGHFNQPKSVVSETKNNISSSGSEEEDRILGRYIDIYI